jgi:hypothetical protein
MSKTSKIRHILILKSYLKLTDQISRLASRALKEYTENSKNSISFPDSSYFRRKMMSYKKLIDIIFQIHDDSDFYLTSFLKKFGDIISNFINTGLEIFEKKWTSTILTYNLFKSKFSLATSIEINPATMNSNQSGDKKLSSFIQETVSAIYESINDDESYWPRYFGTNQRRLTR